MFLWLIPILPFLGFLINGLFGRRMPKSMVNLFAIGSVTLSFLWAVKALVGLSPLETKYIEHYFTWIQSGTLNIAVDFAVDRLTADDDRGVPGRRRELFQLVVQLPRLRS